MYSDKSTMRDSFELKGTWWLPENPEDKLAGFLTYKRGDIKLKLVGQFSSALESNQNYEPGKFQPSIMCGQCDGKLVTLCDLILVNNRYHFGLIVDSSSAFIAGCLIVGWAFESKKELRFSHSHARFSDLEHWVGQSPFEDKGLSKDGYSLSYTTPSKVTAKVSQIDAEISIVSVFSVNQRFSERNIVHRNVTRISPVEPKDLDWFLRTISVFRNLLALAACDQVFSESIELCFSGVPTSHPDGISTVRVFYKQIGDANPVAPDELPDFLFSFESISDQFEKIINSWYQKSVELSTVHDLLFGTMYNSRLYLRFQFLSLMHAIESYDRIQNKSVYLTEEEYESIRLTLVGAIPVSVASDHRESLKNKIKFGFEASMRKRLAMIFKDLSEASVRLVTDDPKAFILRVVDTRNYYTHYGENSKNQAIDEERNLFEVTQRLKILLYILLLKELGLEEDSIVRAISAFPKLNYINDR